MLTEFIMISWHARICTVNHRSRVLYVYCNYNENSQAFRILLKILPQFPMFVLLVLNDTFSTNRLYHVIGVQNIFCVGLGGGHSNINKPKKNTHKHSSTWALWR